MGVGSPLVEARGVGPRGVGPRVVVVGSSGVGKTTLAKRLAGRLGAPHVELDAFMHEPGWVPAEPETFRDRVDRATRGDAWVVDGNYGDPVREVAWPRATTLVWLDYPRHVVMRRVVRRSIARAVTREELWNGNREDWRTWVDAEHPIRWAWAKFPERRQKYPRLLTRFPHLDVLRLRRPREADELVGGLPCR